MNPKYKQLATGSAIGLVVGLAIGFFTVKRIVPADRFEIRETRFFIAGKSARALKINTRTGESWGLMEHGWERIPNSN
jgi:hypothetical protein